MTAKISRIITKENLQRYSQEILEILARENICSTSDLEKRLGESFSTFNGLIQLESRPSASGSKASVISYIVKGKGIPIEIRLNPEHRYSLFFVKSEEKINDYNPELPDPIGNVIQSKKIESSFEKMLEELKQLSQ
ncbi:MAG: hypothetical protein AABX79_01790 [Nanoarchaeota archaeon]